MQTHLAIWIVVLGMATSVTGCASTESSSGTKIVDNLEQSRLKRQPAIVAIVDGVPPVAPTEYSPTDAVKNTIANLLSILGNEALKQPGRFEERRQQIEQVIRQRLNYEQMARRSLGTPWVRLDNTERQEFVSLFVQLLRDKFANRIDQYCDEKVFSLSERREGNFAEVRTIVMGPKVRTSLDFRLENRSGDWLMYDVVIDSASIVRNYRTQFSRIVRDNSYAGLVEKMRQKVFVEKSFEKTAPALALEPRHASASP